MINVGDTVKVIDKFHYDDGTVEEHIPIGTICTVIDMYKEIDGIYSFFLLGQEMKIHILSGTEKMNWKKDIWNGRKTNEI